MSEVLGENKNELLAPAGHPIHILMEEHKVLLEFAGELRNTSKGIMEAEDPSSWETSISLQSISKRRQVTT